MIEKYFDRWNGETDKYKKLMLSILPVQKK